MEKIKLQRLRFSSREVATKALLEALPKEEMKKEKWKLIALTPGSLKIASIIAKKYKLEYDYLFTEAIYAPNNPNCEVAFVSETEEIVIHEPLVKSFKIELDFIYGEAHRKHEEKILSSMYQLRKGDHFKSLEGEKVLFIIEGATTGLRLMTAVKSAIGMGARSINIAVPVIAKDISVALGEIVDSVYSAYELNNYIETSVYYDDYNDITQSDVNRLLYTKKEKND